MRLRLLSLLALYAATGCSDAPRLTSAAVTAKPSRIVSLDLCADQFVLKFVERERILGVSPVASARFSYMRDAAHGVPVVRPSAEDVLALKPDLVVRAYGGGPNAAAFFERAGIEVLNIGWAPDIPAVMTVIDSVATGLGEREHGERVVAQMRERLKQLPAGDTKLTTLYMTPSGVTTGPGSLVHELLLAAGTQNFQTQPGWQPIPLERLAYDSPDLVATASFDAGIDGADRWSPMRHPVARRQLSDRPAVPLEGAWTSCGAWFLMDAVEAVARGASQ